MEYIKRLLGNRIMMKNKKTPDPEPEPEVETHASTDFEDDWNGE